MREMQRILRILRIERVKKNNKDDESRDWGGEFCKVSSVYGFTPSYILEFTLPQFLLYARCANEKIATELNLVNLNAMFGSKPVKKEVMEEDDPNNLVWKFKEAKDKLKEITKRDSFTMKEIYAQINRSSRGI